MKHHTGTVPSGTAASEEPDYHINDPLNLSVEDAAVYDKILEFLTIEYHVNFRHYRQQSVQRRLARRLTLTGQPDYSAYLEYLLKHPFELAHLYDDLLLSYTCFFREPEVFDILKKSVFPQIVLNRSRDLPVRIWVPGCSTGEEVYSIGIAFSEFKEENDLDCAVQLFGTDLVERHITRARNGTYPETIADSFSPERIDRFFVLQPEGYKIAKHLREMCVFAVHDLLRDPPYINMDLISFRNVLIYFDDTLKEKSLPLLHFGLAQNGFLLLGSSETIHKFSDFFEPYDNNAKLFNKKEIVGRSSYHFPSFTFHPRQTPLEEFRIRSTRRNKNAGSLKQQVDAFLAEHYAPPTVIVDSDLTIRHMQGNVSKYLTFSSGVARSNLSRLGREGLTPKLQMAVDRVKNGGKRVIERNIGFKNENDAGAMVDVEIVPLFSDESDEQLYLIMFLEPSGDSGSGQLSTASAGKDTADNGNDIDVLRRKLDDANKNLSLMIDEKDRSNQEIWSMNEELQSTNEELLSLNEEIEAAKEALESGNQELLSLNDELTAKNIELKNAEERNMRTLTLLQDSQKAAGIGAWWIDLPEGRVYWTDEVFNIFNINKQNGIPSHEKFLEMVHPDDRERVIEVLQNQVQYAAEGPHRFTYRIKPDASHIKTVEYIARIQKDYEDQSECLLGTIQDITDREAYIRSLAGKERELKLLVNEMEGIINAFPGMVSVVDRDLTIIHGNNEFGKNLGVKNSSELIGRRCPEIRNSDAAICLRCGISKMFATGESNCTISTLEDERKSGIATKTYAIPLRDSSGTIWAGVEIVMDISDIRRKDKLIRENEVRFRTMINQAGDAVFISDEEGRIIETNTQAEKSTGYSREELIGKTIMDLDGNCSTIEKYRSEWNKASDNGIRRIESFHVRKDGSTFPVEVSASRITISEKPYLLGFVSDISDRIAAMESRLQLERQIYRTQKLESLGVLAGGIAHDFNNLLGGIYGYMDLSLDIDDPVERSILVKKSLKTIDRARSLTSQLLTFSKGGAPVRTVGSLFPFVRTSVEFALSGSNISVEFNIQDDLYLCNFDENQLGQVIDNIVINAKQAMSDGGRLTVTARNCTVTKDDAADIPEGEYVVIDLADTGTGIPNEMLLNVFDPFFTTKKLGSGLGLSTSYSIIKRHDGWIDVKSIPGIGTTFSVYLPAAAAEDRVLVQKPVEYTEFHSGQGTILVMDDEQIIRETSKRMLQSFGYTVVCCKDGDETLRYFETTEKFPAAVILDLTIPGGKGGKEIIDALRRIIPDGVIFVSSGYTEDPTMASPASYGFTASLRKPFTINDLAKVFNKNLR